MHQHICLAMIVSKNFSHLSKFTPLQAAVNHPWENMVLIKGSQDSNCARWGLFLKGPIYCCSTFHWNLLNFHKCSIHPNVTIVFKYRVAVFFFILNCCTNIHIIVGTIVGEVLLIHFLGSTSQQAVNPRLTCCLKMPKVQPYWDNA